VGFFSAFSRPEYATMAGLRDKIRSADEYLRRGMWKADWTKMPWWKRWGMKTMQLGILVVREFIADGCLLRASALTYATLLALVPLLALAFSVLSGLGVQNTLAPIILERVTAGGEEVVTAIVDYINRTNFGQLGAIGLLSLVVTAWALMANIEGSLNSLWATRESRSVFRRFADYTSVLLLGPVFIFIAVSMTGTLRSQAFVQAVLDMALVGQAILLLFHVLPYLLMWAVFTFIYIFMPNHKVQLRAALLGGVVGGTLWQLAQWGYVTSQVGMARYNAIYGTLAALPILMIWIYISWAIVLLGAELAFVWQNQNSIRREILEEKVSFTSQEMVALALMMKVTEIFYRGDGPWSMEKIAEELRLPPKLGRRIADDLVGLGYLTQTQGQEQSLCYQPARPPEAVEVFKLLSDFRGQGADAGRENLAEWKKVRSLEEALAGAECKTLEGVTLKDLALKV
jgi:membrane protein